MYKSLVQCTGTAEADGKGVELPDMRQEKRSSNHWNPKLDKELQRSDQFSKIPGRGRKLILTTFPLSLWLVSLVGSICLPQQSPQISPPFFQLPTSLLSWAECLHRHRQAALAFPPQAHLLLPAHLCFPLGGGFLLSKASPLDGLGPQVLQEGPQSSTLRLLPTSIYTGSRFSPLF